MSMFDNETHTDHDLAHFAFKGIDPATRQPRTRSVACPFCGPRARLTMNRSGLCSFHDTAMRNAVKDLPEAGTGRDTGSGPGVPVETWFAADGPIILDEKMGGTLGGAANEAVAVRISDASEARHKR